MPEMISKESNQDVNNGLSSSRKELVQRGLNLSVMDCATRQQKNGAHADHQMAFESPQIENLTEVTSKKVLENADTSNDMKPTPESHIRNGEFTAATTQFNDGSCHDHKMTNHENQGLYISADVTTKSELETRRMIRKMQSTVHEELESKEHTITLHTDGATNDFQEMKTSSMETSTNFSTDSETKSGADSTKLSELILSTTVSKSCKSPTLANKRERDPHIPSVLRSEERSLCFQQSKRIRLSFEDSLTLGSKCNYGPVPIDRGSTTSHNSVLKTVTSAGIFEDAEEDQTFDFDVYKKIPKRRSSIRPDVNGAISDSIAKTVNKMNSTIDETNLFSKIEKRVVTRKTKKRSTGKEKMAAREILNGKIDLLRILPRQDCNFLSTVCFIFTLEQLEWVLNEDQTVKDASSRQRVREKLMLNLKENPTMIHESKKLEIETPNGQDEKASGRVFSSESWHSVAEHSSSRAFLAGKKLNVWRKSIETWRQGDFNTSDNDQFPLLDGPLSLLFPIGTLQFLKSIRVKSAFDFLCLRRTESGPVVVMFRAWRRQCGLRDMNLHSLSKHLSRIGTCIEESLKGKLLGGNETSKRITGAMGVLSGVAKEFLIDHSKMFSAAQFIEQKTTKIADEFSKWRATKGLSELKSSSAVAMVSAWKTQMKEQLLIQSSEGRFISEERMIEATDSEIKMIGLDDNRGQSKQQSETSSSKACSALDSPEFFSNFFADEQKLDMFKSVGITCARNFIETSKGKNSRLLKALVQMNSPQKNGEKVIVESCITQLHDWSSQMKKRIDGIENTGHDNVYKVGEIGPNLNDNRTSRSVSKESPRFRKSASTKDSDRKSRSVSKQPPRMRKSASMNPFDALSSSNKEFLLASMNISTAADFLATRTTDIAKAFMKWREDRGMPALKGLGAVASISGWKTLVRTKAASLGESELVELNRARNAKHIQVVVNSKPGQAKSGGHKMKNHLENLGSSKKKAKPILQTASKFQAKLSVLSSKTRNVFHFEMEDRIGPSGKCNTYITYLGNDAATDLTMERNVNKKKGCVPITIDLSGKLERINGRNPFDPSTCGTIELSNSISSNLSSHQNKPDNELGITLEEAIKHFVLQKKSFCEGVENTNPTQMVSMVHNEIDIIETKCSRQKFNMFEVLRNGRKKLIVCLVDPIEKGQTVKLELLALETFHSSWLAETNAGKIRKWIQERLSKLPITVLIELLEFVTEDIAVHVFKHLESALKSITPPFCNEKNEPGISSLTSTELVLARRRIHWVAVKIFENLQSTKTDLTCRHVSAELYWTKEFVDKLEDNLELKSIVAEPIRKEIIHEINHEFVYRGFSGFASTKNLWCPMANKLFHCTLDLFVGLSAECGEISLGENLTKKLQSLVLDCILELRESSVFDSHTNYENELTKFALVYKKGCRLDSNILPSFDDIKETLFIRPYVNAMELCNEPVSTLDSVKEIQIVAVHEERSSQGKQVTCFRDLKNTVALEGTCIDVHWYVKTQILAVVRTAVQSSLYTLALDDVKSSFVTIESQILDAAQRALGGTKVKNPSLENFEIDKQSVHSIQGSESKEPLGTTNQLSPTPSSKPFFFGLVWPHLKQEGWSLIAGDAPSEISFVPPVPVKSQNINYHRKDSLLKKRSNYATESNSFGLGYVPKLTKRLLIQCLEQNNEVSQGDGTGQTLSIKRVVDLFVSSTIASIDETDTLTVANMQQKIDKVAIELISLFDKLVPRTFGKEDSLQLGEGKQWSDILDCRYLFKFLIIAPTILQEANLPIQEYQQTIIIVRDLIKFLSENHQDLFSPSIKLPVEEYHCEQSFPSKLLSQMKEDSGVNLGPSKGSKCHESGDGFEVIRPKDRANLTDYVAIVMSQTVIGIATPDDENRAGQPYIVCRHCLGVAGGRYFYGSYESLSTAASSVEKHVMKCAKVDDEIKQEVVKARTYHSKQRKNLTSGAQSAFYARLYNRMQSMRRPYHESELSPGYYNTSISSTQEKISATSNSAVDEKEDTYREFDSHLDVMDYIQNAEPWKSQKPLADLISKYYNCLEYGGKNFDTERSPFVFSSEWIYSKHVNAEF